MELMVRQINRYPAILKFFYDYISSDINIKGYILQTDTPITDALGQCYQNQFFNRYEVNNFRLILDELLEMA